MTADPTDWVIWKYPIPMLDEFSLPLPGDARVLSVQMQDGAIQLWALVQPKAAARARRFRMIGTGHPIAAAEEARLAFVGTFQLSGGALVFHLFEKAMEGESS